ncbi:MAG: Stp1/IreP family PP2C-type Ser/Thr phosphatase [Oscillospiraceae bacterium]|nr:Stp1/IreP family PP2C-type Ser/Thr phosphatase [Oscillospiraceae bacterium]
MEIYGKTDIGRKRRSNQDTFALHRFDDRAVFALICDGMGGVSGGDVASETARDIILSRVTDGYRPGMESNSVRNLLNTAINAANIAIYEKAQKDPQYADMGTTADAVIITADTAHIVHVGDSRVYLLEGDRFEKITRDHSVVQELVEEGKITEEQAEKHPDKNYITRALGIESPPKIDYIEIIFNRQSKLLLCTDGLTNQCSADDIADILDKHDAESACEVLVGRANESGGRDNITVVIIENND